MNQIKYSKGYKYKIEEDCKLVISIKPEKDIIHDFIELKTDGSFLIKYGYSFDGPTNAIDTKTFMCGSLIHDALYQLIREKYLPKSVRKQADKILIKICKEDGMWYPRRVYVYKAVRIFGGSAIKPREVFVAP